MMKIGFNAPTGGALAAPESLARIAAEGEAMGFDYLTFSDHVVIPTDIQARYPYSETGEFPIGARGDRHEQLVEIAFVAAKTRRIGLVTSVMVLPHRPAVLAAKMLATIDVLSGGRLTVGIGAGWLKEEFEALQAPEFTARGRVTDEYIGAFKALWTQPEPRFEGQHVRFSNVLFEPKPVQRPHPPIWIGGESGPALRRAATIGDGWYPIGTNPAHPLDSLQRLQAAVGRLRDLAAQAGRAADAVALAYRVAKFGPDLPKLASDGERRLFSGDDAAVTGDLRALQALGVGSVDFGFAAATAEAQLAAMRGFRERVLARI